MSRNLNPFLKQQQKILVEFKKSLDFTLAVGIFPSMWHRHDIGYTYMEENVLASTWLSRNSIYLAKIM